MNRILVSAVGIAVISVLIYKYGKDQFKHILNKAKDQSDYEKALDDISTKLDEIENIIQLARSVM